MSAPLLTRTLCSGINDKKEAAVLDQESSGPESGSWPPSAPISKS